MDNVKKGQTVTCIKTVILKSADPSRNGLLSFTAGDQYTSPGDGILVDNEHDDHVVSADDARDTWFAEHFIVNEVGKPAYTNADYYDAQFNRIQPAIGSTYGVKFKLTSDDNHTNFISLNDESASALVEFLSNNFTLTLK